MEQRRGHLGSEAQRPRLAGQAVRGCANWGGEAYPLLRRRAVISWCPACQTSMHARGDVNELEACRDSYAWLAACVSMGEPPLRCGQLTSTLGLG